MAKKINKKIIVYSIIGLGFVALMFFVDWMFVIGAVIMMYLNQRGLKKR